MEFPIAKLKKNSKFGIKVVIFLAIPPLLYLLLWFPIYDSFTSSSSPSPSSLVVSNPIYPPSTHSSSVSTYNGWNTSSSSSSSSSHYVTNKSSSHHDHSKILSSNPSSLHNHSSILSSSSSSSSTTITSSNDPSPPPPRRKRTPRRITSCDIFSGEWVPNPEAPYYDNTTCFAIHEHQNCMKFGRPDSGFMKWRWQPDGCELPLFDPYEFLEIMRGKSMAFVGDSISRNHMQSLICLLSRVEYPEDVSLVQDFNFPRWKYKSYNFTVAAFWSTHLVRSKEDGPTGNPTNYYNLYLDEPDPVWSSQIGEFDYVIISSGQWFFRPLLFFDKGKLIGCLYCDKPNVKMLGPFFAYRRAFRTAFRAILEAKRFRGEVFLRTYAPSHFENGVWDQGGDCKRTHPFRSNETELKDMNLEAHTIQLEEFRIARREGKKRGVRFGLIDVTKAMLLRPDGHPSRYGHRPGENLVLFNDCVHWCLPGPIDSWNDFLLDMLRNQV